MTDNTSRKRILTLDGGGIRGLISLEVLVEIERQLRELMGPQTVLADFFDFFAGTSTGAIIATALARRWPVGDIRQFYFDNGKRMFDHAHWWKLLSNRYDGRALKEILKLSFGNATLGEIADGKHLMLVMRNITMDQPWVVSNNPKGRFNRPERPDCQLRLPLWQLIRASTAAPGFFPPESIKIGEHEFIFVDGSISSFTNPAFAAFIRAVAKPYDICWPAGEERILLVSVGTGTAPHLRHEFRVEDYTLLEAAATVPQALILSTVIEQDLLCRIFGNCLTGHQIDKELGDLIGMESPGGAHLFSYARYNEELSAEGLARLGLPDIVSEHVQRIDSVDHIDDLIRIGQRVAHQVDPAHLARWIPRPPS